MFLYVCKETFCKFYGYITREFLGLRILIFQGIIFIWTRTYREIFKSALVYLKISWGVLEITLLSILGKNLWKRQDSGYIFPNVSQILYTKYLLQEFSLKFIYIFKHLGFGPLKSSSYPPKKFVLFASMKAL